VSTVEKTLLIINNLLNFNLSSMSILKYDYFLFYHSLNYAIPHIIVFRNVPAGRNREFSTKLTIFAFAFSAFAA